ncbi:MAG: DUF4886 domain-containing protein [Kiritimatiellae bacterium]|nr:DUF4886 domain-containing protein [Kiritimatiellia bacterium]
MATGKALNGKPYAGNPHVRFDEGEVASAATPRRGSLLYKGKYMFGAAKVFACAMLAGASAAFASAGERSRPLKVLAIGNSFSHSLMAQLPVCAKALPGAELDFATLVIGGCSLERHWDNVVKSSDPEFRPYDVHWSFASAPDKKNPPFDGAMKNGKANIPQMLAAVRWDIVTIQQASHASWDEKTYQPYADNLIAKIRELAPQAEIRIQQTWAYCNADERICADATPGKPGTWGINQQGMHERLTAAYDKLAERHHLKVIPSGDAVSLYRKALPVRFNPPAKDERTAYKDGELPDMGGEPVGSYRWGKGPSWNTSAKDNDVHKLRWDSIHLNMEGEYLQACTWLAALFDDDLSRLDYKPDFLSDEKAALMRKCAVEAVKARKSPCMVASIAAPLLTALADKLSISRAEDIFPAVLKMSESGGGTVELADGTYHFYSNSATNMRFNVSNHDQPDVRPVFLPFIGVTNVAVVAKNAKFVMHGMGTAILVRDSLGVSFRGITIEWDRPFFARAEIVGFEGGGTRVRFPPRDKVVVEDGKVMLCGEDWKVNLRDGNVFDRETHEMIERTADVIFSGKGSEYANGDFLIDVDLSKVGAGAKVGNVYVMRNGYRPHPIVCLDRAKDTVFENFVFRDGFGMGILAQKSENVTLRGGGCYPRDSGEYSSNTIDATHFSNCRGTVTVENCRFEGMMDDALNVHSTCLGIVAKPSDDTIRCCYMHPQAVGFGVFSAGDAVRFIAGKTLENGFVGRVKSVVTHDEREITLVLEQAIPPEYGVGDAVENADWQCAVVFRNNTVANNRARGVLFTTPKRIVCEGNFFDHVSGSAILLAGDAQGWYESGACEDLVIRKNRFRDCLTSVFQYCDALVSIHPEVKDLASQRRRYHRNILIEDNDIETFDVPLLFALSAENVTWRNNRVKRHDRYRGWGRKPFESIGCGNVKVEGVDGPILRTAGGRGRIVRCPDART